MATFFEELYTRLFSPLSRSPSPLPSPQTSPILLAIDDMAPQNKTTLSPSAEMDESAIVESLLAGESATIPGHFPSSPRSGSMSSTISSQSDIANRLTTVTAPQAKLDAMTRHFPKPTEEIDLDEMLARKPLKGTLPHYFKNARDVKVPVKTPAQQAKAFEDAKQELLRAKEQMQSLSFSKRV